MLYTLVKCVFVLNLDSATFKQGKILFKGARVFSFPGFPCRGCSCLLIFRGTQNPLNLLLPASSDRKVTYHTKSF